MHIQTSLLCLFTPAGDLPGAEAERNGRERRRGRHEPVPAGPHHRPRPDPGPHPGPAGSGVRPPEAADLPQDAAPLHDSGFTQVRSFNVLPLDG